MSSDIKFLFKHFENVLIKLDVWIKFSMRYTSVWQKPPNSKYISSNNRQDWCLYTMYSPPIIYRKMAPFLCFLNLTNSCFLIDNIYPTINFINRVQDLSIKWTKTFFQKLDAMSFLQTDMHCHFESEQKYV